MSAYAYRFADGSHLPKGLDAQKVGERLATLTNAHGSTASVIVDDARPDGSPLHAAFTWDDTVAAQLQREAEARHLIRHVIAVPVDVSSERREFRAFVNITERESDESRYIPTVRAMSDPEYRAQIVARALREAESWRQRYAEYSELASIFEAVEKVATTLQAPRRRAQETERVAVAVG